MASSDPDPSSGGTLTVTAEVREGTYGDKVVAVEPGGAEFIPLEERHGRPLKLFWTWMSPNLEFATVFVGVISVAFFGQTLLGASLALVIGTGLGSITHGILSARGPHYGVPQMILSRISFGYRGNALPAGLMALTAGIGWIAVNSVSGTFALNSLTGMPKPLCLLIVFVAQIAVAFFGHNLLHTFERFAFPLLAVAFLLALFILFPKASSGGAPGGGGMGGFLITLGAAFGYAAGWNPYASDYSRYFAPDTSRRATALWAGLGIFISCSVLEIMGAVSVSALPKADWAGSPTDSFTGLMPTAIADLVLLAIALGAVSANAINVYSGTMSFLAMGFTLPLALRRAIVALVFGVLGFVVALIGLNDVTRYENFLLIIAYWVGPWLAVFFTDQYLRRGHHVGGFLFDRRHNPWAGWVSMVLGGGIAIWLFSNQVKYVGPLPKAHPALGDVTFEVGFVLTAVLYFVFYQLQRDRTDEVMVLPTEAAR